MGRLLRQLAACGVEAAAIGVICFFTAQVAAGNDQNKQNLLVTPIQCSCIVTMLLAQCGRDVNLC